MTRRGPHEGSIHRRRDGRWAASVHIGYVDGKRVRRHVLGKTRREVADELDALLRAKKEHLPIPDRRARLGPFLSTWLEEVSRPRIRATTYRSHESIVRVHLVPGLGRIAIAKLAPADVQGFLDRKSASRLSPRRVDVILAILRKALATAERWGLVSRNVARLVDAPKVPKHEVTPLTPGQARRLIDASVDDRLRGLWITALGTGCRQGELLGLRWEDVDLDAGRLRVRHSLARIEGRLVLLEPKTGRSRRTITLPGVVMEALRAHRTRQRMEHLVAGSRWVDSGHVFATTIGTPMEAAVVTRAFGRALERAGLPHCRFHDLRHAAATFLLAGGFTLEDVKNLLGHSSIVLTSDTYGHVLQRRQRQAAMGMDAVLGG